MLPPEQRTEIVRGLEIARMDKTWRDIAKGVVRQIQAKMGDDEFPVLEKRPREKKRRVADAKSGVVLFDEGDVGININHMADRGYYPFHTDDRGRAENMPDIDGSGDSIVTYAETESLILIAPREGAYGVGCVGLYVGGGQLWGMRTLAHASAADALTPDWSVREDAVHAVLNTTTLPRFSVNFRFGGFDQVFDTPPPAPPKELAFANAGKRNRAPGDAADDGAPKVPKNIQKELEIHMAV